MKAFKIKTLIAFHLLFVFGLHYCFGQEQNTSSALKIEEFNWTIEIPNTFEPIDMEEWNTTVQKGKEVIENTFDESIENQAVTLFTYRDGQFNNFEANWQPFDEAIDGEYLKTYREVNKITYRAFEEELPGVKLDTLTTVQPVGQLEFNRFEVTVDFPNGLKLKTISFSRLFDTKELTLNITYIDEKVGEVMLKAFLNSKFE
jgi:hypothetical protein